MRIKYNKKWVDVKELEIECQTHDGSIKFTQEKDNYNQDLFKVIHQQKNESERYVVTTHTHMKENNKLDVVVVKIQ